MIKVGDKAKIIFHWNVSPYDYSDDKMNDIVIKASKKYNIPKESIRVIPNFIMQNSKGENIDISNDLILNIQNPQFQLQLFNEYLQLNNIENYDFDFIKKIDAEINANIDYDVYDKFRRYSIKWIKWSNFLSYGSDNFFDFTSLHDLILLNGEPANQSGKTTFAIDLLHFLLFGKTEKARTQDKIFNKWRKEETEVCVEGCLTIDGENYIIKRTLTRPQLKKRTNKSKTTQKVEYYKLVGDSLTELAEYADNQQEENSIQTNKIIKETIGNENDFDLIVCATSSNLDDLIEKKETERGRILSRWIGLLPIEKKEEVAKLKFNTEIKPYLLSNKYNTENLLLEREAFFLRISENLSSIKRYTEENIKIDSDISLKEELKKSLLIARQTIDDSIMKLDITTLEKTIENLTNKGLEIKTKINDLLNQISSINVGDYSDNDYEILMRKNIELNAKLSEARVQFKTLTQRIIELEKSEFCPTCGKKFDNVDNSSLIKTLQEERSEIKKIGEETSLFLKDVVKSINDMRDARENFINKSKLEIQKSALEVQIANLRSQLIEHKQQLSNFYKNEEAIRKNNEIDLTLRNCDTTLIGLRNTKETNNLYIANLNSQIETYKDNISNIEITIEAIKKEENVVRNWKIYLDMIGKNGITKMVLRKALPIINAQMAHLLSEVCDFTVSISITDKNEINFDIINNGVKSDISSASGFEKTASALALRFVLARNSIIPKLNYIVLDEVLSRVANENLDKIKLLLDKIKDEYAFVIIVTHNEYFKDKADGVITISKDDNHISKINTKMR